MCWATARNFRVWWKALSYRTGIQQNWSVLNPNTRTTPRIVMDRVPPNKKFGYSSNRNWLNGMGWGIAIRLRKLSGSWRKVLSGRLKLGLWKARPKSLSIFFAEFLKFSNIAIDFCFYIILFCIWNCFVKRKMMQNALILNILI